MRPSVTDEDKVVCGTEIFNGLGVKSLVEEQHNGVECELLLRVRSTTAVPDFLARQEIRENLVLDFEW